MVGLPFFDISANILTQYCPVFASLVKDEPICNCPRIWDRGANPRHKVAVAKYAMKLQSAVIVALALDTWTAAAAAIG